jgi:BirA family biotin operon repressor/biotin-[acetyl-CoA-carboxylase] ligase
MDRVLLSLAENMTVAVSGEKLAEDLGCSHSKVLRLVDRLREAGVEIVGEPFTGFRLIRLPDIVIPERFSDRLHTGKLGRRLYHLYTVGSTNAFALKLLADEKLSPHGTLVVAEEQTAGRGRLGRSWVSSGRVGLYMTLILRPQIPASLAPLMTLAAAVAAHETIERVTAVGIDVKWPNDLLVGRKKVGGILCELQAELDRVRSITIGMGLNVNNEEFPEDLGEIATSLLIESGRRHSRIALLVDFLATFEELFTRFAARGPQVVIDAWARASSFSQGRLLEIHDGVRTIRGVTEGLNALGALRVRRADGGIEEVYSGDVLAWE